MLKSRHDDASKKEPEDTPIAAPTTCPFCLSVKLAPPPKKISTSTYWRCESCGQMWNVGRHVSPPPVVRGPWNRDY